MAKTDVKLYAIDTLGKATTTTISDVNPDATSSQLVQMGHLFNNLTQNTYSKTDRINTINCDTEGGSSKQTPTLTLSPNTLSLANIQASKRNVTVSYDGDGQYGFIFNTIQREVNINNVYDLGGGSMEFFISATNGVTSGFEVKVITTETDTYTAAEATLTITA